MLYVRYYYIITCDSSVPPQGPVKAFRAHTICLKPRGKAPGPKSIAAVKRFIASLSQEESVANIVEEVRLIHRGLPLLLHQLLLDSDKVPA